jgi:hypothetical protein
VESTQLASAPKSVVSVESSSVSQSASVRWAERSTYCRVSVAGHRLTFTMTLSAPLSPPAASS